MHAHSRAAAQQASYHACKTAKANRGDGAKDPHKRKFYRATIWKASGIRAQDGGLVLARARGLAPVLVALPPGLAGLPKAAFVELRLVYDLVGRRHRWHLVVNDGVVTEPVIHAHNLVKIYQVAGLEVVALQGLDLTVQGGELVALVGPSGAGKSTLLAALTGLERPSAGALTVAGQNVLTLGAAALARYRREVVGVVWQQTGRNLLTYLSARENIELLAQLNGSARAVRRAWAHELLDAVGMAGLAHRRPTTLSGGQQQRVALACALANRPQILLADEPTGEVDWPTAAQILALLQTLRQRYGLTIVLVTHDPRVAAHADRVVAIRDGRMSSETARAASQDERITDRVSCRAGSSSGWRLRGRWPQSRAWCWRMSRRAILIASWGRR